MCLLGNAGGVLQFALFSLLVRCALQAIAMSGKQQFPFMVRVHA